MYFKFETSKFIDIYTCISKISRNLEIWSNLSFTLFPFLSGNSTNTRMMFSQNYSSALLYCVCPLFSVIFFSQIFSWIPYSVSFLHDLFIRSLALCLSSVFHLFYFWVNCRLWTAAHHHPVLLLCTLSQMSAFNMTELNVECWCMSMHLLYVGVE